MENQNQIRERKTVDGALVGFSPVSSTRIFWKSRKRSASGRNLDEVTEDNANETPNKQGGEPMTEEKTQDPTAIADISERRKALFEPLEPITNINGRRPSAESLLPPPDFDSANYPRGWLIGKKRKLVNVDVVESMRKIAIQEMNRKVLFPKPSPFMITGLIIRIFWQAKRKLWEGCYPWKIKQQLCKQSPPSTWLVPVCSHKHHWTHPSSVGDFSTGLFSCAIAAITIFINIFITFSLQVECSFSFQGSFCRRRERVLTLNMSDCSSEADVNCESINKY